MSRGSTSELQINELIQNARKCYHYLNTIPPLKEYTLDDFQSFPIVEKQMIRENPDAFIDPKVDRTKLIAEYTSGSTGVPIICYRTNKEQMQLGILLSAARKRYCADINYERMVEFGAYSKHFSFNKHVKKSSLMLSTYFNESRDLALYWRKIVDFDPTFIQGFPSMLYSLAKFSFDTNMKINLPSLSFLETRAEMLSNKQRDFIQQALGMPVANHYGSKEFWTIAYSCSFGYLHLIEESVFIEIVDKEGNIITDSRIGDIILTGKIVKSMPLIRYRIGDTGRLLSGSCSCGSSRQRLEVFGRESDDIVTISGKLNRSILSPIWLMLHEIPGIFQIQIVQLGLDEFSINYEGNTSIPNEISEKIHNHLSFLLRLKTLKLSFNQVSYISRDPVSGKIKNFIPLSRDLKI